MGTRGGLKESFECVRESEEVLGAFGARTEADGLFRYEQWLDRSEATLTHERRRRTLILRNT